MVFSSMIFLWIFLPSVLLLDRVVGAIFGNGASNWVLLAASMLFYAWGEPIYVLLMIASILVNWIIGCLIGKSDSRQLRQIYLITAVIIDIGALFVFKYIGLLPLPIGISFYTFQAVSYIVDVYRNECKHQKNPLTLGLYISFFPQLIAGPILRYKTIEMQLANRKKDINKTTEGIRRFVYGLGKKVLIANTLAGAVDAIYSLDATQITGVMAWIASLLYTFQIYYDFSGYSDMAIGLGKMFGFDFSENFNYPYTSHSIREFWNRWHISLGTWFKEYVYIPLGGNRCGAGRTYMNLLIVFFLTGMWHGAGLSFILWGLYHGFFSILERLWLGTILKRKKYFSWVYTFLVVNFGWVLFRIEKLFGALGIIQRMLLPWRYCSSNFLLQEVINPYVIVTAIASVFGIGFMSRILAGTTTEQRWKNSAVEYIFLLIVLWLSLCSLAAESYNPFIYFRF